jgi:Trk-type K+ transport system membrane component
VSVLNPPPFATWLLSLTDADAWKDAVAGDLFEEYQERRSSRWYWRQVLTVVAIAFLKDLRNHWVLLLRALALAFLFLNWSHDLLNALSLTQRLFRMVRPVLGWWPSLAITAAVEPLLECGAAGFALALTHRKRQATMVLFYGAALFVFLVCLCANRAHWTPECVLFWESSVFALAGALAGGYLGCAWDHPLFRRPHRLST